MIDALAPFRLPDGPVAIQFSGGRSSGYMLRYILDAHDGRLPPDAHITFANTGREMPETLAYVERVGREWGVDVAWIERDEEAGFRRVGPGTNQPASVDGEPFADIIERKGFLPNVVSRFCTADLKVRPIRDYLRWLGYDHWSAVIGFRADEAHRAIGTRRSAERERWSVHFPMIEAGVTKRDVAAFWAAQPFDLALPNIHGKTPLGNCDGCFLKSEANRAFLARYMPERAAWWADMEARVGASFDKRVRWRDLIAHAADQPDWVFDADSGIYCDSSLGGCHD